MKFLLKNLKSYGQGLPVECILFAKLSGYQKFQYGNIVIFGVTTDMDLRLQVQVASVWNMYKTRLDSNAPLPSDNDQRKETFFSGVTFAQI